MAHLSRTAPRHPARSGLGAITNRLTIIFYDNLTASTASLQAVEDESEKIYQLVPLLSFPDFQLGLRRGVLVRYWHTSPFAALQRFGRYRSSILAARKIAD